jgi:hypothetical protein
VERDGLLIINGVAAGWSSFLQGHSVNRILPRPGDR